MLSIITVVYRNYEVLDDLIASLVVQSSGIYTLTIVDLTDAADRQLIPWIRKIEQKATYLTTGNNGYGHGVNVGVAHALTHGALHLAIINPDVILDSDFVLHATHSLANNPKAIVGGKILYAPGFEYHAKTIPSGQIPPPRLNDTYSVWYAGGEIDWAHATIHHVGVDTLDTGKDRTPTPTRMVSGCCMLYNKTVHDIVGSWDEKYFMYYEDADYCVRSVQKGVRVLYDPTVVMWHKNAQSTGGSGSSFQTLHMARSRLRFGLKYAPLRTKLHLIKNYILAGN